MRKFYRRISEKKTSTIVGLLLAEVLIVFFVCACGNNLKEDNKVIDGITNETMVESNPDFVKAQELYIANKCISCHGTDLSGRVGANSNLQKVGNKLTAEQIQNQIKNGGGGMYPYKDKLTEEEVILLTNWLRSKK
ncbi:c-type cytochrome [Paenibacillus alba]|uniref:Cytochrome c n=1 Tax=Paenibacillus alba TaxID=1197127 RepID=A0ABU6FVV8_9BACL|nr:cytochrome c [Paenibacillus alba]MEC0226037.1 cytochrome c [Paenibacillus alba]